MATVPPFQPGLITALIGTYLASFGQGLCLGYPTSSYLFWETSYPYISNTLFHLLLPIGAVLGTGVNVLIHKRLGRNKIMTIGGIAALLCIVFLIVGAKVEHSLWSLYVGNVLMGIACGIVSHTAPAYLHEVSHHERRGKLGAGHSAAMAVGLSLSIMFGFQVPVTSLIVVTFLPFVLSSLLLQLAPASPKWLAETGRSSEEIKTALEQLHGDSHYVEKELNYLQHKELQSYSLDITRPSILKPFIVSICLMAAQQASGINGIIENIYVLIGKETGLIVFGVTYIVDSFLVLVLVDRVSRTHLLYASQGLQIVSLLTMGIAWTAGKMNNAEDISPVFSIALCVFIGGYAVGSGPVPWIMVNELLPTKTSTYTTAASTSTNWIFDTIVTRVFTFLLARYGGLTTFIIFAVFAIISVIFVKFFVPDTAGLTLEELEAFLRRIYEEVFNHHPVLSDRNPVINELELEHEPEGNMNEIPLR